MSDFPELDFGPELQLEPFTLPAESETKESHGFAGTILNQHDNSVAQGPSANPPMDSWRIIMLGDVAVGKTALAEQFVNGNFIEEYDPIGEEVYRRTVNIDNQLCMLDIVAPSGQEEYAFMVTHLIRDANAFLLVYSVTSRDSFDKIRAIQEHLSRLKSSSRQSPQLSCVLLANKVDLEAERQVSTEEGKQLAREFHCKYHEVSAKTLSGVQEGFSDLVRVSRDALKGIDRENGTEGEKVLDEKGSERSTRRGRRKKRHGSCILM